MKSADFGRKTLEKCALIPEGKVATYKGLAAAIGSKGAARAVGSALSKNRNLVKVPCHRVIRSDGFAGGYAKGVGRKIALLRREGVEVSKRGFVDLKRFLFRFD